MTLCTLTILRSALADREVRVGLLGRQAQRRSEQANEKSRDVTQDKGLPIAIGTGQAHCSSVSPIETSRPHPSGRSKRLVVSHDYGPMRHRGAVLPLSGFRQEGEAGALQGVPDRPSDHGPRSA